jgi:hypothetical protein
MTEEDEARKRREKESLVADVVSELKKDEIKKSALAKLKSGWPHYLGELFKHPAVLVLLTFACTSLLGDWLASAWQSRQKALDEKYQITDQLNRAFAENITGAQDILGLYTYEANAKNRDEVEKERWLYWQQKSRDWRVSSEVISQKLKVNFQDSNIQKTFEGIKETQYQTSVDIKNLKYNVEATNWGVLSEQAFKDKRTELLLTINGTKDRVGKLLDMMMKEIK